MSTAIRILILVGVLVIFIVCYIICIKLAKKFDNNSNGDKITGPINWIYVITLVIVLVLLLFSYPNGVFLTMEKVKFIFYILLGVSVVITGIIIALYEVLIKNNDKYIFIILLVPIIELIVIIGLNSFFDSQRCIEKTNKTIVSEGIEPFITKQAKGIFVKYDDNGNVVSCKYYDIENNNLEDNEIDGSEIRDVVYLENNEDSHIEKTEISIDYINHEMESSSDQYFYTETKKTYVLFINEDQIVKYN